MHAHGGLESGASKGWVDMGGDCFLPQNAVEDLVVFLSLVLQRRLWTPLGQFFGLHPGPTASFRWNPMQVHHPKGRAGREVSTCFNPPSLAEKTLCQGQ